MPKPKKFSPLTKPLSRKELRKEVRAAGRLAVGPEKRLLQAERRTSKVQSRRIKDWFPQYKKQINQAAGRTAQAYAGADAGIAQASSQAQSYANRMRQELAAEAQSDANLRGVQYDPSGSVVNAQAQLARINSANTLRGVTAAQGASQQAYLQDKRRIAQREMIEQLLREQARRRSYSGDLRNVAQRQSDAMLQERSRLRDSERDFYLGLLAARGEKAARRMSRNESRRDRSFERQQNRKDRQFSKNESEKDRRAAAQGSDSDSGGGGGSPGSKVDRQRAMAYLRQGEYSSPKDAISYLINRGVDPATARWAVKRAKKKAKKGKKGGAAGAIGDVIGGAGGAVGGGRG